MMIFAAVYLYFLIQVIMASKGKDSDFIVNEMKEKMNGIPSMVENGAKNVKNKVSDESVIVIENAKKLTKKAGTALRQGKDYIVDKYNGLKTKINNTKIASEKKVKPNESTIDKNPVGELVKTNKELIDLTKKLIDKYDKNLKLLEEINKNLLKKK